jgi:hypothetical protein
MVFVIAGLVLAGGAGVATVTGTSGDGVLAGGFSDLIKRIGYAIGVAERGAAEIASGIILNNNPGDIEDSNGNLIVYASIEDGWNALYHQVSLFFSGSHIYNPTMTISQVAQKYVGTADWPNWARNVANGLGVSVDTQLNQLT